MTDLRTQLYAAVIEMERRGLVAGSSGNASVRLASVDAGGRYLITPSGLPYEHMKPADLVEVDENIEPVTGDGIPSTESALHLGHLPPPARCRRCSTHPLPLCQRLGGRRETDSANR